jgi:hypothetical protein
MFDNFKDCRASDADHRSGDDVRLAVWVIVAGRLRLHPNPLNSSCIGRLDALCVVSGANPIKVSFKGIRLWLWLLKLAKRLGKRRIRRAQH